MGRAKFLTKREIAAFLTEHGNALSRGDEQTIARMWASPALVVEPEGAHHVESPEGVHEVFSETMRHLTEQGARTLPEMERTQWLSPRVALVEVRWPHVTDEGKEVGEERATYALRGDEDGHMRICVALARETNRAA